MEGGGANVFGQFWFAHCTKKGPKWPKKCLDDL